MRAVRLSTTSYSIVVVWLKRVGRANQTTVIVVLQRRRGAQRIGNARDFAMTVVAVSRFVAQFVGVLEQREIILN